MDPASLGDLCPLQDPSLFDLYCQGENQGTASVHGLSSDQEWEPRTALQYEDELFPEVSLTIGDSERNLCFLTRSQTRNPASQTVKANNYHDSTTNERYVTWTQLLHDPSPANSHHGITQDPSGVQPSFLSFGDETNQVIRRVSRYFSLYLLSPRDILRLTARATSCIM